MSRQVVSVKDEKGKPTRKEVLCYSREFRAANHRGIEYGAGFEIGRFQRPKIVPNGNLTYNPKTGEPIGNEKRLGSPETVFEIEVPKTKQERKKLIDSIIGVILQLIYSFITGS